METTSTFDLRPARVVVVVAVLSAVLAPGGLSRSSTAQAQSAGLCDTGSVEQFSDVKPDAYAAAYIHCMKALGLSLGRGDGTYGPVSELTRGEMASFLVRLWRDVLRNGCPEGPAAPFTDISGTAHQENIECLYALGITKGVTATTYGPSAKLTAAQISRFLLRTYEKAGRSCPRADDELDEAAACLLSLHVVPTEEEARSATPVIRAQMAVYVIGVWHHLMDRGLPPAPPIRPSDRQLEIRSAESQLIDLVNGLRAGLGLEPYEYDPTVAAEARRWAATMAGTGELRRNPSLAEAHPLARRMAQNVWLQPEVGDVSFLELTESAFGSMEVDPDAYARMSDPRLTHTGVGMVLDRNGFWVAQDFVQHDPRPTEAEISDGESYMAELVNELRAGLGVGSLQYHHGVAAVARRWSRTMSERDAFEHNPSYTSEYPPGWTRAGENIFWSSAGRSTVRETMKHAFDALSDSPGHYRNMIHPDFNHIGVGLFVDSSGGYWVTQNFARY